MPNILTLLNKQIKTDSLESIKFFQSQRGRLEVYESLFLE